MEQIMAIVNQILAWLKDLLAKFGLGDLFGTPETAPADAE